MAVAVLTPAEDARARPAVAALTPEVAEGMAAQWPVVAGGGAALLTPNRKGGWATAQLSWEDGQRRRWRPGGALSFASARGRATPRGETGNGARCQEVWSGCPGKTSRFGSPSPSAWASKGRHNLARGQFPRGLLAPGKGRDPSGIVGCQSRP